VPSDVVKVNDADLKITDGLGLEVNVEDVVDAAQNENPDLQFLKLGDNTIPPDQYVFGLVISKGSR
jgi:ABC-type Zn uptake system ZnuABC Zn-binding protein ZnuA